MSIEATAILGLFFGLWAHEQSHAYDKRPTRFLLIFITVMGLSALSLLTVAGLRALGVGS